MPKAEPSEEKHQKLHNIGEIDVTNKIQSSHQINELNETWGKDASRFARIYYLICFVFKKYYKA